MIDCKGNFSELFTVKITRSVAKSINIPLVFKMFETFGDEKVIGESTHLPGLSNTQIVPVLLGPEPAQTEDPEDRTSKRTQWVHIWNAEHFFQGLLRGYIL